MEVLLNFAQWENLSPLEKALKLQQCAFLLNYSGVISNKMLYNFICI